MQHEFKGKSALFTGGTKGLGLAAARMFAQQGCDVYLSYRSDEAGANAAAHSVRELGVKCEVLKADLGEDGAMERVFDELAGHTKSLDYYIHNAAATAFKDLIELKSHHIDKTFNITVKGFVLGVQRAAAMMKPGSAVISVSGMDTLKAVPRHGLLGAAKAALETLTAYYAHELAGRGIRVNGVNPGFLATDSTRKYLGPAFEHVNKLFADSTPLKREPSLEEIGEVICFLASKRSGWIVGQTLCVDGGLDFSLQNTVST
ncbi:MAG: SDR family oxidoreductase [Deltaproteobacteria bacterium]|nr:SDR family oxidoreductase [Deltaproteobacteria bacterium]